MRSFKSNENIHKKEGGSYYVVSANKASSVTLHSAGIESQSLFMRDNGKCDIPLAAWARVERYSALKEVLTPTVPKGPENVKITTIYRCKGRLFRAATLHNDSCCGLQIIWKEILWKYSIQNLKTADTFLLSLFMRNNGWCDIPHAACVRIVHQLLLGQNSNRSPQKLRQCFCRSIFWNEFWNIKWKHNLASIVRISWNLPFCVQFAHAYTNKTFNMHVLLEKWFESEF